MYVYKKVLTYGQVVTALQNMIADGRRSPDEPFTMNGNEFEEIIDSRNNDQVVVQGSCEVRRKVPPLQL